eukprot:7227191-Ditylum_brightwellii.AAC.1
MAEPIDDVCKVLDIIQDKLIHVSTELDNANAKITELHAKFDTMTTLLHDIHSYVLSQKPAKADEKGNEEENTEAKTKEVSPPQAKPLPNTMFLLIAGSKKETSAAHFKDCMKCLVHCLISEVIIERVSI